MNKRTLWISLAFLLTLAVLISLNFPASAQGDGPATRTPQPSPVGNGGNATWTVKAMSFASKYPHGFDFAVEASSTGGRLKSASVAWQYSPIARSRKRQLATVDAAAGTAKLTGARDDVPQWVRVDYYWILTDEAGNVYETPHQFAEYADNTRKWSRAESEDIVVFWQEGLPKETGQMVLDAMRQQREFYLKNFPVPLSYKPRAILYADDKPWLEWAPFFNVPRSGGGRIVGQTSDVWGGTVQVFYAPTGLRDLTYGTVLHEVAHLYQYEQRFGLLSGTRLDTWFIEGNATYFELYQSRDFLQRVRTMAEAGRLPTLQRGGPTLGGGNVRDPYDIGFAFWTWLAETYGADAQRKVWQQLIDGRRQNEALKAVTGLEFTAMEVAFRNWLGASNPVVPTVEPTETLAYTFLPSPTPFPTPGGD